MEYVVLAGVIIILLGSLFATYFFMKGKRNNNLNTDFDCRLYSSLAINNECETLEKVEENYKEVIVDKELRVKEY